MLDIDKRRKATAFFCLDAHGKNERCLLGRFRTKHFDDSTAWESAHSERAIDQNVTRGNDVDINDLCVTETHDRAFAVIFRDLLNRKVEILISCGGEFVCACFFFGFGRHIGIPLSTSVASLRQGKSKRLFRASAEKMRAAGSHRQKKKPVTGLSNCDV